MRRIPLIPLFALALPLTAQPATNEISFEYREGLLWLKAATQSGRPLNLLLDTGAGISILNKAAAEKLGIKLGPSVPVHGVDTALKGHFIKTVPLTVEGLQLPGPSLAVDLQSLSTSCEQPVDGLVGADFFRGRIVQIDFEACKLRLLSDISSCRQSDTLPLQLRPCGMRVPISVNGCKSQWVRLDTGCASALQWVTSTVRTEDCMMRKTAIGLTQISIPQTETTVQIGSQEFQNIPTGLHDKPIFQGEAGLLGNGLLFRFFRVTLDAKSCRLILEQRN